MKIPSFLEKSFPTDDEYRLISVTQIFQAENGENVVAYKLALTFHRLPDIKNKLERKKQLVKIENYGATFTFKTVCDIAYQRLLVVGSIWSNYGNPKVILPSSFLPNVAISDVFLESNRVKKTDTSEFTVNFGVTDKEKIRHADILMYEFDKPLFRHKDVEGENCFYEHTPPWPAPEEIHFVAINSFEIHRYFFSSTNASLTDFNSRLLIPNQFYLKNRDSNQFFNFYKSKYEDGKHKVCLLNKEDMVDSHIIGNLVYYPDFKRKVVQMQNVLNSHRYYLFSFIDGLPIIEFKRMKGYAFRVTRKSDGKKGIYFIQLTSINKTIDHSYCPYVPINDGMKVHFPAGNNLGNTENKGLPKDVVGYNYGGGSNRSDKPKEIELSWADELLNPKKDIKIEEIPKELTDDDRKIPIENRDSLGSVQGEGGKLNPPALTDGNPGFQPVYRTTIQARDYFDHFPDILNAVILNLELSGLNVLLNFYDEDLLTQPNKFIINSDNLNVIDKPNDQKWFLYLGVIEIRTNEKSRYYYLFEKTSKSKPNSRTWLYCAEKYNIIESDSIIERIQTFLYEDHPSDATQKEPNNKFNHKQSEVQFINGQYRDCPIPQNEAIKMQIKKITNRILKTFEM